MSEAVLGAIPQSEWIASNRSAFAVAAPNPKGAGHVVVLPKRQIASWSEAGPDELLDLLALIEEVRQRIGEVHLVHDFHVRFEVGTSTEQLLIDVVPIRDPAKSRDESPALEGQSSHLIDGRAGRTLKLELLRCLINPEFNRVDLLVSFIMKSGLRTVLSKLAQSIERGAQVRVLTTDYLQITDADALAQLLDLAETAHGLPGSIELRVFSDPLTSFHPKAYFFWSSTTQTASGFVGSSNLSLSGIETGVEWSLATSEVQPMITSFEALWDDERSSAVDHDFLRGYRQRWRPTAGHTVELGIETEAPTEPPTPRPIQAEALVALEQTRGDGFGAGLVVMATGLGKTWLAAFDTTRPEFGRTLFVAHREEILRQSRDVFRRVRPDAELGLYYGEEKQPAADVVFASVQTLARHLDEFEPDEFDYLVIDEFHHAAASSYRKVIDHFDPAFLLGLTATPDRMDGADLMALCGDNVVFECGLIEGIDRSELVPFHYWGIKDVADYVGIPWRNGRFDPAMLAERVETQQRAQQAFDEWSDKCASRTLAFCASVSHADFMTSYFQARGIRAAAVHSMPGSADRIDTLEGLRAGALDVVFAVDMFNEGVDVPEIDSVLMLRPTESPVVFLQQLGRGLRLSDDKDRLRVVDFVGNHRSFLHRPRSLLGLTRSGVPSTAAVMSAMASGDWDLPTGCSVVYDVEAIDLLRSLAAQRIPVSDALENFCVEYHEEHGIRPTAAQAQRSGLNPSAARKRSGSWFGFLHRLDLLEASERRAMDAVSDVLARIESESITKSYKLVTLRSLLTLGALRAGASLAEISSTAQHLVIVDPRLVDDCRSAALPDPASASSATWSTFWRKWPLEHLTKGAAPLFRFVDERFEPTFIVPPEDGDAFDAMAAEIVEWRLADYLLRPRPGDTAMRCRVSHSGGTPIVFLDRGRYPDLPMGEEAFTAHGETFVGRFVKIALNVSTRPGSDVNVLPELLRSWFGPNAGHPGTNHAVLVERNDESWTMRPASQASENRLAGLIGQRFRRQQVPPLFGQEFNPGNWNSGHVSLGGDVVLFVTLAKSEDMAHGANYHDAFESPDIFVWSSQTSTRPDSKKGREILDAEANGPRIHLFTRAKKSDVAFEYRGRVVPISHEGSAPMSVRFRMV